MALQLKWKLSNGSIYAPEGTDDINTILCSVWLSIDAVDRRINGFDTSKHQQRLELARIAQELINIGAVSREAISSNLYPAPSSTSISKEKKAHRSGPSHLYVGAYVLHSDSVGLEAENARLRKRIADTERLLQVSNELRAITIGVNAVNDEIHIMQALAQRLNLDIININQVTNQVKSLQCSIRNIADVETIVKSHRNLKKALKGYIPMAITQETRAKRTDKDHREYDLDLITHVDADLEQVNATFDGDDYNTEVLRGTTVCIFYESAMKRSAHYDVMKRAGLNPRLQSSGRYSHVQHAEFDLMRYYRQAVASPIDLETSRAARKNVGKQLTAQTQAEETQTVPLDLLVWVDGWRGLTTSVKVRFVDISGKVFPSGGTPPFRILEYNGPEKRIGEFFDFIERSVESTHREALEVRNTGLLCRVTRVMFIADHPAMSKVCGTLIGGSYPSPFSSVHVDNKAWSPFGLTPRNTIADVMYAKKMSVEDKTVLDREKKWGSFYNKKNKCIMPSLFENSDDPTLDRGKIFLVPPIMHLSHDFVSLIHNICRMFKPIEVDPDSTPEEIKTKKARNADLARLAKFEPPSRTTGCNEQVKGRKMIASIGNSLYMAFPPPVQPLFRLFAYLQEHYYSHEEATDDIITWHRLTALLVHLFSLTMCLNTTSTVSESIPIRPPSKVAKKAPSIDTLHGLARVAVLPEIQSKIRVPLGRIIEESFERDFIGNQDSRVHLRRNQMVLERTILKEQVELFYRFLRGVVSYGRQSTDVPHQIRLKTMRVHRCCKDAKHWIRIRSEGTGTLDEGDCQKLLPLFEGQVDGLWKKVLRQVGLVFDGQWLDIDVHEEGEISLDVCICGKYE
ncbi:hypothetical protein J8273_5809 [Carpediemonas membranifera]|uniref:Uncharacterized protein n=1 Tax=Carpediemonas membranifera TaxID=201153 RepID=A0A8J6E115_9EUKA|nr:hypothetical protein J8273_5809 [Carpediemonas membranifera]|eukprot:KAG9392873.1 hypothetical protein J8273_5809 [Carpediemonas membranifera]